VQAPKIVPQNRGSTRTIFQLFIHAQLEVISSFCLPLWRAL
jgi:hypothetical protein